MNRQEMIDKLIIDSIDTIYNSGNFMEDNDWLYDIFKSGFVGFSNMTDDELLKELNNRGLLDEEEEE